MTDFSGGSEQPEKFISFKYATEELPDAPVEIRIEPGPDIF